MKVKMKDHLLSI